MKKLHIYCEVKSDRLVITWRQEPFQFEPDGSVFFKYGTIEGEESDVDSDLVFRFLEAK